MTAFDLSQAPDVAEVPQQADLSEHRLAILRQAAGELGLVEPHTAGITIPPSTVTKKGADRLLEYTMVAFGTDVNGWLGSFNALIAKDHKHTTWCGIFALWAVKTGAAVIAKDYAGALALAMSNPRLAFLAESFFDFYEPDYTDGDRWSTYKDLEWRAGPGITFPTGQGPQRHAKAPQALSRWTSRGERPPIKPGDIGYVNIPLANPPPGSDGFSHHHFLVEKIHRVGNQVVYYTIEGNFHDQQVLRWKRSPGAIEDIHAFYDIDTLAQ
ncbi:MAG: hypothetical protein H6712_03550 [Myxococcales bacterium]|nr:hypothetical protein [Myxococcales bacterium]MCB9712902.1 hypothetical protein [Myxococcales bacterium]